MREPVLILYHVVPKVLSHVSRLGGRSLYLLSQLAGPWVFFKTYVTVIFLNIYRNIVFKSEVKKNEVSHMNIQSCGKNLNICALKWLCF